MGFNINGNYRCSCGREFTSAQAFRGHKSHCVVHMGCQRVIDKNNEIRKNASRKAAETLRRNSVKKKMAQLEQWIAEQHRCERCGKVMTVKYGSGRFCCKSCANSKKHTEETKKKISNALTGRTYERTPSLRNTPQELYEVNPKKCTECGVSLPYEHRRAKFCTECRKAYMRITLSNISKRAVLLSGGNLNVDGTRGRAKYGTYNGIPCDSSWELAFVVYCMDNNIPISRNHKGFEYYYNGSKHYYYPDFVVKDELVEIKNYETDLVKVKVDSIPSDIKFKILYKKEMLPYLEYAKNKYGKNYCEVLYDRSRPSYLDKQNK